MMNRFRIICFLVCLASGAELCGASILGKKRKHPEESFNRAERARQVYLEQRENINVALFIVSYICSLPQQSNLVAAAKNYEVDIAEQLPREASVLVPLIAEYAGLKSNIWLEYAKNVLGAGEWDMCDFLPRFQKRYPELFKDPQFLAERLIGCVAEDMGKMHPCTPFEYSLKQRGKCMRCSRDVIIDSSGCMPLNIQHGPFFMGLSHALEEENSYCVCGGRIASPTCYNKLPEILVTRTQGFYDEVPEFLWSEELCSFPQKRDQGQGRYRLLAYMYQLIPGSSPYLCLNNGERILLFRVGNDWYHKLFSDVEKVPQSYVNELRCNKNGTHRPTLQVYERLDDEMSPAQRKLAEVLALEERR